MPQPHRPDIVVILPDQLRADYLGCYEAPVATPAIDRLAASGARFTRATASSPLCVPSRTQFLTGTHAMRTGVLENDCGLRPDFREAGYTTWIHELAAAGYATASIGKMHFYPWDRDMGFQRRITAEDKRHVAIQDDYWHYLQAHGHGKIHASELPGYQENMGATPPPVPWEHSIDHFVGTRSADYIGQQPTDEPFALVVGFPGPHDPYDPDPRFLRLIDGAHTSAETDPPDDDVWEILGLVADNFREPWARLELGDVPRSARAIVRRHYAALVQQIDVEVGRIVAALEESGRADTTIVVLASDHGDFLGSKGMIGKATFHRESIDIPLIVNGPGVSTGTSDALVELADIGPTLLDLAGVAVPEVMDAQRLPSPVIDGVRPRDRIVGALANGWMLREDRFKFAVYRTGERQLIDTVEDPYETRNLATDPRHLATTLRMHAELSALVMDLVGRSHDDLAVTPADRADRLFNRSGWERRYPAPARAWSGWPSSHADEQREREVANG